MKIFFLSMTRRDFYARRRRGGDTTLCQVLENDVESLANASYHFQLVLVEGEGDFEVYLDDDYDDRLCCTTTSCSFIYLWEEQSSEVIFEELDSEYVDLIHNGHNGRHL